MKKGYLVICTILCILLLGACSSSTKMNAPRNGMLLVGEDQKLEAVLKEHQSEIKESYLYKVKEAKVKEGEYELGTLILSSKTAEELVKMGLLREARGTDDVAVTDPLKALPEIQKGRGALSAISRYKDMHSVEIGGKSLPVQYETNSWFGYTRQKDHRFIIIVDEETFEQLSAVETTMQIFRFKLTYGQLQDVKGDNTSIEAIQINSDWMRLTKGMEAGIEYSWPVSFKESK